MGRRSVGLCAAAVAAAALSGCAGATSPNATVNGSSLTVYASDPPGADPQQAQDVYDAQRLALDQAGDRVGRFRVSLRRLTSGKLTDNARAAISDSSTIAYLGEIAPHDSALTIGITGGVSGSPILQVSPTDNALELTQASPAVKSAPNVYYSLLKDNGRTFGRVVPADDKEAAAEVGAMKAMRVTHLYVAEDGTAYGDAVALAVYQRAQAAGIAVLPAAGLPDRSATGQKVASSGADALFFGSSAAPEAAALFDDVASLASKARLFAASGLSDGAFAAVLGPRAQAVTYVSSPGFMPTDLTLGGKQFIASFRARYGREPGETAIFGYESMALVLDVLRRAGQRASSRGQVVRDFFATRDRKSALGTYSIDSAGDTTLTPAPFVLNHFSGGRLVAVMAIRG